MKRLTIALLLMLATTSLFAQVKITGKALDADTKKPIDFLVVNEKGTNNFTYTDEDGSYSITVSNANATLDFAMAGYTTESQSIAGRSTINVELKSETQVLDEVVAVGYSRKRNSNITGTVSTVDSKKIEKIVAANFTQALQGAAPGLQITVNSGDPAAGSTMLIRGIGSINASNTPLFVIDGMPSPNADFSAINPNDIESVSILKDASATSIYGSRGSNGVILITTKRGKSGETNIQLSSKLAWKTRTTSKLNLMNAQEKLTYEKLLGVGKGATLTDDEISSYPINTKWEDEIFRTGLTQQYDLSISGGDDKTRIYLSAQMYDDQGIVIGSDMRRYSGRLNLDHKVRSWLSVGVNLNAGYYDLTLLSESSNGTNPMYNVFAAQPYLSPYNADGSYYLGSDLPSGGINIFEYQETTPQYTQKLQLAGTTYADIKLGNKVSFRTNLGLEYGNRYIYQYSYPDAVISQLLETYGSRYDGYARSGNTSWSNLFTYRDIFADYHNLTVIAGTEWLDYNERSTTAKADYYASRNIDALSNGAKPDAPSGSSSGYSMMSYLTNASYNYDSKYMLDASLRFDGSSRLSPDNRWSPFWSVGVGWNMHREDFMQPLQGIIDNLKLAVNYGTQGNLPSTYYSWRRLISQGSYNNETTLYPSNVGNRNLTWEKSNQVSFSINSMWFNNRIKFDVDIFNRITHDLINPIPLSPTTGQGSILSNVGKLRNRGVELLLRGDIISTKDVNLSLTGTFATAKNEVLELYEGSVISGMYIRQEGYSLGQYRMVRYAGVNPATGEALYYDKNGNVTNVFNSDDAVILEGKTNLPKYYGSFDLNFSWKNLSASASFYYSVGSYVFNTSRATSLSDGATASNRNQDRSLLYDAWQNPGDITNTPKQSINNISYSTDRFLEDNSYGRLRNISLSYALPLTLVSKVGLKGARVSASCENLFTITKYKGFDPEVQGDDQNHYPVSRNFLVGLTLNF